MVTGENACPTLMWYRRRDSNPHCLVPKTSASCLLGYAGKSSSWRTWHDSNVRPQPSQSCALIPLSYRSKLSDMLQLVVVYLRDLASEDNDKLKFAGHFWRRRQELNLHATLRGDLANRCHTVRRRLRGNFELQISDCGLSDKLVELVAGSVKGLFPRLTTS